MQVYTDNDLTDAYLAGKNGKPLPKPEGVEMVEVTKLNGVEYDGLYIIQNKVKSNG